MPASLLTSPHATPAGAVRRSARTAARACVISSVTALTVVAAPAHADVPEGWSDVRAVDGLEALLFLLILLAVYVPAMKRGEPLLPDHGAGEVQWIGGPREGTKELPAPDTEGSRAGGASGRW